MGRLAIRPLVQRAVRSTVAQPADRKHAAADPQTDPEDPFSITSGKTPIRA
jgi:hypothetical protein